ncbi:mannose-1-phosphate guanylyltransferase [Demequina aurantiaca]|uniref:mannose-1-phosphate guanylyltransferase n=1 Tax=Demequina aurantiaca TaxID=676200 RepID=UPI0007848853
MTGSHNIHDAADSSPAPSTTDRTDSGPGSEAVIDDFVAVIPAGGVGSRLWPLSQPHRPKFLLDLLGTGTTLIQDTVTRLAPLAAQTIVVTGQRHADAVAAQVPQVPAANLVAEPTPRDSMAAIALAAAIIQLRHGDRIMGSFAADHVIGEPHEFRAAVRTAVVAARTGKVVTIGINPTEASSAFGYIAQGDELPDASGAFAVREFTEKPDPQTAATMLASGGYVWNAGMFVVSTAVLLEHLERLQPGIYAGVTEIAAAWDSDDRQATLERVWPTLTKIAIDHAIAEPVAAAGGVAVVPGAFDWHDVGDFDSLVGLLTPDADGVTRIGRTAVVGTFGSQGVVAVGGTKVLAVVGLDDVVIVESDEALLVLSRAAAQQVKDAATAGL